MPADANERIIDDSYTAVFPLGKEQIASHLCSESKLKLSNMRVSMDTNGCIVTESTDGKCMIQVKEETNRWSIEGFPFDVNPSESPKDILPKPQFIPRDALETIAKGFPRRKNHQKLGWQKAAVFSFQKDSNEFEVGRADKQGRATVDKFPKTPTIVFPPIEDVLEATNKEAATVTVRLELGLLKKTIEAMGHAGVEYVNLSLWDPKKAIKLEGVNKWGSITARGVTALLMPVAEKTSN